MPKNATREALSKEARSAIAKAAQRKRRERERADRAGVTPTEVAPETITPVAVVAPVANSAPEKRPRARRRPMPKAFAGAHGYAEKRLAEAIRERAECMHKLAMLNAEIPSLVQIIKALGNSQIPAEAMQVNIPDIQDSPAAGFGPVAQGGAIGFDAPDERDDQFLEEKGIMKGQWV